MMMFIDFKVVKESEVHNNKLNSSSSQGTSTGLKGNQTDIKDTNFEYEDNEWDIGEFSFSNYLHRMHLT
jgi:hypothetical protein